MNAPTLPPQVLAALHHPLLQQGLVLLAALMAGLFILTLAARLEITASARPARALAAYRADAVDTPLEKLGAAVLRRVPALANLFGLAQHRRWLELVGPAWSTPAVVGLALVLGLAGLALFLLTLIPALLVAPVIGFLLPFVRQRSAAEKVKRRVQNTLPDLSAMLAAEIAANNPPDTGIERAAELGGPLARILELALAEQMINGRPLFQRNTTPGMLPEFVEQYPLPALRAFVAQLNLVAKTGAAGPDLMSGLAHTLIVEYKDRALREAEALESRLAVPSVGFFFLPFLFLILVPLLLPVLSAL